MRGGLNVISSKIAPATFYKVRHQIRVVRVAAIMGGKSSPARADVKGSHALAMPPLPAAHHPKCFLRKSIARPHASSAAWRSWTEARCSLAKAWSAS
ncbi:hypothetical protein BN961_02356 [Afipia felis]|uniref:Uncharacterized protein n=1 Tax=Afipia felis TaxID=1035 RepID=A0A090MNJ5_AFIFE|nr:hypothetical protein BN961_02356 [Afipia felis]